MFGIPVKLVEWGALVACVVIAIHFYAAGHQDAVQVLQPKIDVLTSVVQIDDATINQLRTDAQINEDLIAQYQDAVTLLNRQAFDDEHALQDLKASDKDVDAYLSVPIPDPLRRLLNNEPAIDDPSRKISVPAAP